jgi:hypothetical protein
MLIVLGRPLAWNGPPPGRVALWLGLSTGLLLTLYWWPTASQPTASWFRAHMYNEFQWPAASAWPVVLPRVVAGMAVILLAFWWVFAEWPGVRDWLLTVAVAGGWVWLFFNGYTLSRLTTAPEFLRNQLLVQLGLTACVATLLAGHWFRRWPAWYLAHGLVLGGFVLLNTSWSSAYADLSTRQFEVRAASTQLAAVLPDDAIVVGRRAAALLRPTLVRAALCGLSYEPRDYLDRITRLSTRHPHRPLYWLVDSDGCPPWDYYRQSGESRWKVAPVRVVTVPSGDLLTLEPTEAQELPRVPLYLFRVVPPAP